MKRFIAIASALVVVLLPAQSLAFGFSFGGHYYGSRTSSNTTLADEQTSSTTSSTDGEHNSQTGLPRLKNLADKEVNHRLGALNSLEAIVKNAKCLSAADKSAVEAQIQAEQSALPTVKTKIDNDTDDTTEKTDVKSITTDFRTFALMMPKVHLLRVADHLTCAITKVTAYADKLQTDIDAAKTAGKDVSADQTTMTDMRSQLKTAGDDLSAALASIINTTPDQFNADKTIITKIKSQLDAARQAIIAALKDGNTIRNNLKQQGDV